MDFTWANQFAKNALKSAQKKIDSVLDITVEEAEEDEEDENDITAGSSRLGALSEEEDGDGASGAWDDHECLTNFSSYDDEPQGLGVVDSEPNPIRDSHHPASCGHSTASTSPDEGCSGGDEHEVSPLNGEEHPVESVSEERHLEADESTNTLILMDASPSVVVVTEGDGDEGMLEEGSVPEDMSSQGQHHDETLTIASSDIEVLRQGDSWSVMSMSSSAFCAETPVAASASISLEPLAQQDGGSKGSAVTSRDREVEIARLKSHIQHQERRIGDLLEQNKKLNKKSNDMLALKAARNKQTSTEAKLMKKLSEKEEELASLLLEGEKLAETNGKLTKELKRLRASLAEQEQLAKKGAQTEIDRDLAREELRGLNAENAKLRASIKSMESDSSRVKAADEILVNDLKRREERLERMTSEVQDAESAKEAAEDEVKRLQSLMEQMSSKADEREISTKGVEEITRGLNAAVQEERQKNERHMNYIASLEKRLAAMMESQRDAAQMVAIANSPLLESIRELETNAKSVETAHEIAINEKDLFISSLSKAKDELTQENKRLMNELTKVRSGNDEASQAMVDMSDRLQHAENDNQRLRGSVERSERLLEGLKTSLSAKEVEIDKLYLRLRQEAENAQRQSIEKQEQIDEMTSRCEELDREMLVLRERNEQPSAQVQQSTVKRRLSPVSNALLVDPVPYISPAAAQAS